MKKKVLTMALFVVFAITTISMTSCASSNPSNTSYWFSKANAEFIAYNDDTDNLSEAGNYWYFTSAKDMNIEMYLLTDAYDMYSATYLYVNDEQVQSETDTGVYTYAYKLSLKKGDKIKIHAFWTNSLMTTEEGFTMKQISIKQDGATYILNEYNKIK